MVIEIAIYNVVKYYFIFTQRKWLLQLLDGQAYALRTFRTRGYGSTYRSQTLLRLH